MSNQEEEIGIVWNQQNACWHFPVIQYSKSCAQIPGWPD
jgi:hypothetical protein